MTFEYDVALSFAGEDRKYVEEVAKVLKASGVRVFYDKFEETNLWGKDLSLHLDFIYRKSAKYCVLFISQHYKKKIWTNYEMRTVFARAIESNSEYILPARFDSTELEGLRSTIGYLDLVNLQPTTFANKILEKLEKPTKISEKQNIHKNANSSELSNLEQKYKSYLWKYSQSGSNLNLELAFRIPDGRNWLPCGVFQLKLTNLKDFVQYISSSGTLIVIPPSLIINNQFHEGYCFHISPEQNQGTYTGVSESTPLIINYPFDNLLRNELRKFSADSYLSMEIRGTGGPTYLSSLIKLTDALW